MKDKIIKGAHAKKATSPDNVSPRDLSMVGDSAMHSVLPISNKSLSNSFFPLNWKSSHVNL